MYAKRVLFLLVWILGIAVAIAACAPAVPYDQMPGGDLYSSAQGNRMTADALMRQAAWQEQALTATAEAPIVRITETAAALAVQATQAQSTSVAAAATQAGAMTQTAAWWTPTPNMTGTLDALAISAAQTQTTLNLQQAETSNDFRAMLPAYSFVVAVLVLAIVLMLIIRKQRFQPAKVDARGNVLPILDIVDGTVTDVDRNPNFKGSMKNDWLVKLVAYWFEKKTGAKLMLPEVTAKRQDDITFRDQMIDLATRGLPAPGKNEDARKAKVGEMMAQPRAQLSGPTVHLVSSDMVRPIMNDVAPQIAQDSIEAELVSDTQKEGVA
jgi:hypothetical protein